MVLVRPAYTYSNVKTLSLAESLWLPFYVNMILRVLIYALKWLRCWQRGWLLNTVESCRVEHPVCQWQDMYSASTALPVVLHERKCILSVNQMFLSISIRWAAVVLLLPPSPSSSSFSSVYFFFFFTYLAQYAFMIPNDFSVFHSTVQSLSSSLNCALTSPSLSVLLEVLHRRCFFESVPLFFFWQDGGGGGCGGIYPVL